MNSGVQYLVNSRLFMMFVENANALTQPTNGRYRRQEFDNAISALSAGLVDPVGDISSASRSMFLQSCIRPRDPRGPSISKPPHNRLQITKVVLLFVYIKLCWFPAVWNITLVPCYSITVYFQRRQISTRYDHRQHDRRFARGINKVTIQLIKYTSIASVVYIVIRC